MRTNGIGPPISVITTSTGTAAHRREHRVDRAHRQHASDDMESIGRSTT